MMVRRLTAAEPKLAERVDVYSMDSIGRRLHELLVGEIRLATREDVDSALETAFNQSAAIRLSPGFVLGEWETVVDAWQLSTWPEYRDVARLGRRTRLPEAQREQLWAIFEQMSESLRRKGLSTTASMLARVEAALRGSDNRPFDFVVVDEAQDVSVAQLRFLSALGGERNDSLFFAGDLGQRIFQQPFSWRSLGVDIRGRSRRLRVNYRTSHQIRAQADRLLGPELADVDGNVEER